MTAPHDAPPTFELLVEKTWELVSAPRMDQYPDTTRLLRSIVSVAREEQLTRGFQTDTPIPLELFLNHPSQIGTNHAGHFPHLTKLIRIVDHLADQTAFGAPE